MCHTLKNSERTVKNKNKKQNNWKSSFEQANIRLIFVKVIMY